ncbi:MAG TPA: PepSY-associated TM helix domain-containing protein [Rhodanobacter sp.]|jgi:uncharacterized iron-regulated membrane protein|nr:PepSY-associated TM helix domain-containing protein [Rhodanobacter sp.]
MRDSVHQATPAHSASHVRQWLRQAHLWGGLSLGLVYALIALSGSVLSLQGPLLRALHPELAAHALPTRTQQAAVLERIVRDWSTQGLRNSDLPTAALPSWQLYFDGGVRRYLDPVSGELLLTRSPSTDVLLALRYWHTNLLGGQAGETLLGVLGWISVFLLLSGLVLWWPRRGQLRAHLTPRAQPPARRWLSWHRSLGVLSLPLLLVVTLTGTLMVYHGGAKHALQVLFADAPTAPPPAPIPSRDAAIDWVAVLDAAQHALPGAELHRVALPSAQDGRVSVRARAADEWHTVGRSVVWLDPYQARVLGVVDATKEGTGARLGNAIYPLHAGSDTGSFWWATVLLSGLLPPFFLVTGFLYWRARRLPRVAPAARDRFTLGVGK